MNQNIPILPKARHAARGSRSFLRQAFCLAALFFSLPGPGAVHGQTGLGETWEWRNPLPQGSGLWAMAESDGNLIAVGRAGTVLTTTDGMSWTPRVSGTRQWLRAVAASGATVVAVGREGDIVTSTDGGLTWALRSSNAVVWNTVIHGGGLWVASGSTGSPSYTGRAMTSPDGLTWTRVTVPNNLGGGDCVWTGNRFVLGGSWEGVATSEDGITWTQRAAGLSVYGLAWTGSRVVAVGYESPVNRIDISPDGISWTVAHQHVDGDSDNPLPLIGVVWTGAQLLAWKKDSTVAYTSPTGETWTPRYLSIYPTAAAGIGSTLLVGGDGGRMVHSPDGGVTWNPVSSGVRGNLNAITRFAGRWVAVGGDGSLTSSADGLSWTPASSGTISLLRGIAWHNGLWVAVGASIWTSTDGVAWTNRPLSSLAPGTTIYSVIHAGSQWVATAYGAVLTSPDGITWQERPVGSENRAVAWNGSRLIVVGGNEAGNESTARVDLSDDGGLTWTTQHFGGGFLRGVVWTGSQFVVVGDYGRIYTSPTGAAGTWTSQTSGTNLHLRGVVTESAGLVAVGGKSLSGPVILTSPDGVTWTPRTAPTTQLLYSISKAGSLYVATGYDGVVLTSPDAVTWTARTTPTTHELYAAAWDGAQLLVAGEAGTILASTGAPLKWKSVVLLPGIDIAVRLTWFSTAGRIYDIESTTTLAPPWLPIPGSPRTATGPEEFIDFIEPGPSPAPRRFFRVRERP